MSEFPKSGLGSWAEWRRRTKNAGMFDCHVDTGPASYGITDATALDAWEAILSSHAPESFNKTIGTTIASVQQDVADRKAG